MPALILSLTLAGALSTSSYCCHNQMMWPMLLPGQSLLTTLFCSSCQGPGNRYLHPPWGWGACRGHPTCRPLLQRSRRCQAGCGRSWPSGACMLMDPNVSTANPPSPHSMWWPYMQDALCKRMVAAMTIVKHTVVDSCMLEPKMCSICCKDDLS